MPKMIWLGMDVHAASITVARYEDQAATAMVQTIANDPAQVRRLVRRLPAGCDVRACYEAGSCGYGLHRQFTVLRVHFDVIAPAFVPGRPATACAARSARPTRPPTAQSPGRGWPASAACAGSPRSAR